MKLDKNQVNEILHLWENGVSTMEIAERFGITPRRVLQIIKDPHLKKPGRKREELAGDIKKKILRLREEGYTISRIQEHLKKEGIKVSRYKIWRTINEYKEAEFMRIVEEFNVLCNRNVPVVFIGVSPRIEKGRRILLICNISECKVLYCCVLDNPKLKDIIEIFDSFVLSVLRPQLVMIFPVSPLVPTNGFENRFIRHLNNLGIDYLWVPNEIKKRCWENFTMIKKLFRETGNCPENIITDIEGLCKKILEARRHGYNGEDKKIPENKNNGRD